MKNYFQNFVYWSGIIFLGIIFGFILKFSSAWVEPSDGGNILTPLNTGPLPQSKAGGLVLNVGGAPTGLIVDKGLVGIGTTAPRGALDVTSNNNGFLPPRLTTAQRDAIIAPVAGLMIFNTDTKKFNGFNGTSWDYLGKVDSTPAGTIAYFDLGSCPSGWNEVTGARGRYLVGTQNASNRGLSVGQALGDGENRSTGAHNHPLNDPGHLHQYYSAGRDTASGQGWDKSLYAVGNTSRSTTGITLSEPPGSVGGTNAPYIEFLVCKKN